MTAFIIYALVFLSLIRFNGFFGLFTDDRISKTQIALLFFFKLLAVPVFYMVYQRIYGSIYDFDAGNFYNDSKAVNVFARSNFIEYLKLMFGLQDDRPGSYVYNECLLKTYTWDNGMIRDFLYNDNRIIIRIHSLLHFMPFSTYFVHALFNCFLSFTGIWFLYKAIKEFFAGKEVLVLVVLCFFPALWFYTGAVLKEGLTIFFMGCLVYQLRQLIYGRRSWISALWLLFLIFISLLLKPYILFFSGICFCLFFAIHRAQRRFKLLTFLGILAIGVIAINAVSLLLKKKSLVEAAMAQQRMFADAAKGGIFLIDSVKFVRLEFDSSLVARVPGKVNRLTIKKGAPYIYWEHTHQQDTLFCSANADTLTEFEEAYRLPESGSNFDLGNYRKGVAGLVATCWYYSLFYPLFFNAGKALQLLASAENAALIVSLLIVIAGLVRNRKDAFFPTVIVVMALAICLLVGLTTPNSGAIFRYRSPAVIFIVLAALYYLPARKSLIDT